MTSLLMLALLGQTTLQIPGFTAYLEPNPEAFEMDETRGFVGWNDPASHVLWYGKLTQVGTLKVSVQLDGKLASQYKMEVAGQIHGASPQDGLVNFGEYHIEKPGYQRFRLFAVGKKGELLGVPKTLVLTGAPTAGAQFNLKPRRNAASVHLKYQTAEDAKIVRFYNEVTAREEPIYTYYCAEGFGRGYFGMQVNSPTERRIIFSVWDSGNEAVDRSKVGDDDKVKLLAKGDGVVAGDFGNEGTGGHSHLVYPWKKGQAYKFLVTAKPDGAATIYTGWFWFPEKKAWGLIAKFRAPKDGGYLRNLYSFNENFGGANGHLRRFAEFGNQWIQTEDGTWARVTKATFSHDATGKEDRKDYAGGVIRGNLFLSNGGFIDNGVKFGDLFERPATGEKPSVEGTN